MFKHRIQNSEQFPHAGHQGHLLGFARFAKPCIKLPYHGVISGGGQSSHIEGRSYLASTSPDTTLTPKSAAVSVEGCYPDQSCLGDKGG